MLEQNGDVQNGAVEQPPVVVNMSNIRPFDITRPHEWKGWSKLLQFNFTAMRIKENEMKRAHFFSICGEPLYNLASNILHPREVDEVAYPEIIQALNDHFKPQVNEVAAYYRFHHCNQKVDQSVNEFVAELRKLATDCNFRVVQDDMIRNQLVCGIRDVQVRSRLLQIADLTLQKAVEIALRAESASGNIREMTEDKGAVHSMSQSKGHRDGSRQSCPASSSNQSESSASQNFTCFRCAGNHKVSQCQFDPASLICTACNKQGHVAKICQGSSQKSKSKPGKSKHFQKNQASTIHSTQAHQESADRSIEEGNTYRITAQPAGSSTPVHQLLVINGVIVLILRTIFTFSLLPREKKQLGHGRYLKPSWSHYKLTVVRW